MQYPAPRVLLADAHGDTRALYETWLVQRGFSVIHAASADDMLQRVRGAAPDVIVTELMLPGGGTHVIDQLRADPVTRDAVVIVLTTQNAIALRDRAIEAGADLYLVKPCGAARLGDVMASASRARFERLAPRVDGDRAALLRAAQRTFAIRERVRAGAAAERPAAPPTPD
jgi:two-component system chemotaxis response regulator CheY